MEPVHFFLSSSNFSFLFIMQLCNLNFQGCSIKLTCLFPQPSIFSSLFIMQFCNVNLQGSNMEPSHCYPEALIFSSLYTMTWYCKILTSKPIVWSCIISTVNPRISLPFSSHDYESSTFKAATCSWCNFEILIFKVAICGRFSSLELKFLHPFINQLCNLNLQGYIMELAHLFPPTLKFLLIFHHATLIAQPSRL